MSIVCTFSDRDTAAAPSVIRERAKGSGKTVPRPPALGVGEGCLSAARGRHRQRARRRRYGRPCWPDSRCPHRGVPPPIQVPPWQVCPCPQTLPQLPQLEKSVWGSMQAPLHLSLPLLRRHRLPRAAVAGRWLPPAAASTASVARTVRRVGRGCVPKVRITVSKRVGSMAGNLQSSGVDGGSPSPPSWCQNLSRVADRSGTHSLPRPRDQRMGQTTYVAGCVG